MSFNTLEIQVAALDRDVHQMNRAIKAPSASWNSREERETLELIAQQANEERAEIEDELTN